MSYTNLNNPANYQLQSFGQDGMRTISTTQAYVEGEYYRVLVATEDSTLSATSMVGDDLASIDVYAGTTIYGLFTAVTVTAGEVTAYLAGRTDIDDVWAYIRAYGVAGGATIEGEDCAKAAISPLLDKYYAQASLVMVPSLYKTSIVYSERPLSTDGQLAFARSSSATRIAPNGLIEKVRTNLFYPSNMTSNVTLNGVTRTTGQADPFGGADAVKFSATATTGSHRWYNLSFPPTPSAHTMSIYVKADGVNTFALYGTGGVNYVIWDLSTQSVLSSSGSLLRSLVSIGDGWYRASMTFTGGSWCGFYLTNGTTIGWTGDGTSGMLATGFQVEETDFGPTDYIPTTTTAVSVGPVANLPRLNYPINSDGSVGCPSLLLEPQRTNVVFPSNASSNWSALGGATATPNATTSPDGYVNATAMYETNTTSNFVLYKDFTVATGAVSIYAIVKTNGRNIQLGDLGGGGSENARFNLVDGTVIAQNTSNNAYIESYGNGWYKVGFSMTKSGTLFRPGLYTLDYETSSSTHVGDSTKGIFIYHVQGEQASYSTSVIPTTTATVTRTSESCSKTGISSLIGQSEGTLYWEGYVTPAGDWNSLLSVEVLGARFINLRLNPSNQIELGSGNLSSDIAIAGSTPLSSGTYYKIAGAYKSGQNVLYVNGVQIGTSAAAFTTPTLTDFRFNVWNVYDEQKRTAQALLFPTRLSNASLAELTTV
jgi:hypothetical protein